MENEEIQEDTSEFPDFAAFHPSYVLLSYEGCRYENAGVFPASNVPKSFAAKRNPT